MKCSICRNQIGTVFLNKIIGTYVKDSNRKLEPVCFQCQKKFGSKEEILKAMK